MAEPFLAEIRLGAFAFAPQGWALCNGQLLPINQNQAVFSLLGTRYGGDGRTTFALPDLRGRVPLHMGVTFLLGQRGGESTHVLTQAEMPPHTHPLLATSSNGSLTGAAGNVPAASTKPAYASGGPDTAMSPATVSSVGGSQAHENMPPYLVLNFIIALEGIFPSQN